MKLSIWQFVALLVAAALGYFIWAFWWADQDHAQWVRSMRSLFYDTEEEMEENKPTQQTESSSTDGWIR